MASTLIAMRHAHADARTDLPDEKRPLTAAGRELALSTGVLLAELGYIPELIVASSATRTIETATLVADALNTAHASKPVPRIVRKSDLYLAPAQVYVPVILQEISDESTVLVVGHNPGVGVLMRTLSGQQFSVSPGTTSVFSIESDWRELNGLPGVSATLLQLIVNGTVFE